MDKKIVAEVDEAFHKIVKAKAAQEGKTITQVVVELLKAWLTEEKDDE